MKKPSLSNFVVNLYNFFADNHLRQYNDLISLIDRAEKKSLILQRMARYQFTEAIPSDMLKEYDYLFEAEFKGLTFFPYRKIGVLNEVVISRDKKKHMFYILLGGGKRLYYPSCFSKEQCLESYRILIEGDQILQGGYLEKAPHCYEAKGWEVSSGDVLIDCGGAEGLFTLAHVDKVKKAYIIEGDPKWYPALKETFSPFPQVEIVQKYLSAEDSASTVTLSSILQKHEGSSCFVKMDIEGSEKTVISQACPYLATRDDVKLVCCTYHYHDDARILSELFDGIGYEHSFSDGYIFFALYDMPKKPYLRHTLIRAKNKKKE